MNVELLPRRAPPGAMTKALGVGGGDSNFLAPFLERWRRLFRLHALTWRPEILGRFDDVLEVCCAKIPVGE
jgi:hypothetical protein